MRILLADDHWFTADSIGNLVREQVPGGVLHTAESLDEAVEKAKNIEEIDLIILDLHMPGMNHFDGIAAIKRVRPKVPVAILSADDEPGSIRGALAHGAAGYILKTLSRDSMLAVMRLLIAGHTFAPGGALLPAERATDDALGPSDNRTKKVALSVRETEVFNLIIKGLNNKVISEKLNLTEATVKEHVRNVLRKHDCKNRVELLAKIGREHSY